MKKTFLKFPKRAVGYTSRRFPQVAHSSVAYLTDAEQAAQKELLDKIQARIDTALSTRATKEEIQAIKDAMPSDMFKDFPLEQLRSLANDKTGALAMLTAQGLELQKLKAEMKQQPEDMSIRSQVANWMKENETSIKAIKERSNPSATLSPFEVKLNLRAVASPMTPASVNPTASAYISRYEVAPGYNEVLRKEPTFWDFIKKGTTGSPVYIWRNKKPTEGEAAFIAPGVYKPAISFTVESETSNAKKIAVNEKVATELLEDIDGFTTWVEDELFYALMIKVNDTLQGNGAGSSTVPQGLQNMSVAYNALTGVSTTNPTFWDAVKAAVTQLRVTRFRGQIVCFANPVDVANGVMTKANSQGQLFIPPVTGAIIVEDLNMALGSIQVVAIDYYKVLIYKAFRMEWGLENDDLTKNLRTVIGEMRLHQFHSENYDGFAIYDTIENIKAAITEA